MCKRLILNSGSTTIINVLQNVGVSTGYFKRVFLSKERHHAYQENGPLKSTEVQKSIRKKQHAKRKGFTDSHSEKGVTYEAGKF